MDAVDILILALRLVFVALLYLFLVVLLRRAFAATRPTAAPRLYLRVLEPGASSLHTGAVLELGTGTTFGRGGRADLVLADTAVSVEHARVDRVGRQWLVADLGSTNGTKVNDAIVRDRAPLAEGDVLTLGTVRFEVVAH